MTCRSDLLIGYIIYTICVANKFTSYSRTIYYYIACKSDRKYCAFRVKGKRKMVKPNKEKKEIITEIDS